MKDHECQSSVKMESTSVNLRMETWRLCTKLSKGEQEYQVRTCNRYMLVFSLSQLIHHIIFHREEKNYRNHFKSEEKVIKRENCLNFSFLDLSYLIYINVLGNRLCIFGDINYIPLSWIINTSIWKFVMMIYRPKMSKTITSFWFKTQFTFCKQLGIIKS